MIGIALALANLAPGEALAAEASVDAIRIASHGHVTRVVIDLSDQVSYHHIALGQPPRLAIDLPEVDWTLGEDASKAIGLIKGFRFGRPSPGVSRIVLDLAQPFEIKRVFELPPNGKHGHRVVTDLIGMPVQGGVNGAATPLAERTGSQKAALTVVRPPAPKPSLPPEKRIVVIDPGHGGVDPGAIGSKMQILEKDVALRTALELRSRLEKTGRYEVIMTRDDDRVVRLRDRLRIARDSGGELFVSLHADSLVQAPDIRGASVYTLSERASNQEAARLARKENRADILAGIDLSNQEDIVTEILIDLAQRDAKNKSIELAEALVQQLGDVTRMARRRRAQAGFVVLKSPDMPSVLVELGYLSNPADEQALANDGHVAALAGAVARAIDVYFGVGSS